MKMLHVGLRAEDVDRWLGFYTTLGYKVVGAVPETGFESLTMLKLPGDEFVSVELVHNPTAGTVDPWCSDTPAGRRKAPPDFFHGLHFIERCAGFD